MVIRRGRPLHPRSRSRSTSCRARRSSYFLFHAQHGARGLEALRKEEELHAYREMLLIRRFEEKAGQMYGMGLIGGFCHLYIGQEAVVVGMQMALKEGDQVITGYRDHGHMLACGMESPTASWPS
jgi:pyruvate dehydrogenase E1 component alpha subunit